MVYRGIFLGYAPGFTCWVCESGGTGKKGRVRFRVILARRSTSVVYFGHSLPGNGFGRAIVGVVHTTIQGGVTIVPVGFGVIQSIAGLGAGVSLPRSLVRGYCRGLNFGGNNFAANMGTKVEGYVQGGLIIGERELSVTRARGLFRTTARVVGGRQNNSPSLTPCHRTISFLVRRVRGTVSKNRAWGNGSRGGAPYFVP